MSVRATTYLQVEPEFFPYDSSRVRSAKIVRTTQRPPMHNQLPGTVLVKITIELPEAAFLPLQPQAVVTVPEDLAVARSIIEVTVDDPGDPFSDQST